ncbi:MAG: aspartate--tRNA ligase [Deltaproteobacteria bacterium]|jgi:aspartyl-tRNA synthetase|nr:aspartate--tRNA ligase [Deltaproteobacteria bacterium]
MKIPGLKDRKYNCGQLRGANIGERVILMGWIDNLRELGGALFLDLRDRYGITQVVFSKEKDANLLQKVQRFSREDVIAVEGTVLSRQGNVTDKISTGEIELEALDVNRFSESQTTPFPIKDEISSNISTRLKYRYLDLRRNPLQNKIIKRSQISHYLRSFLFNNNFLEIETPFMVKNTPGGARNFIVPSRLNPGKFYSLAESPQIYKQLLMVSGFDRYYQIAKCFRDEDPRQDRQMEFTQIDLELSFADMDDVMEFVEKMFLDLWSKLNLEFEESDFPRMTWQQAMDKYGTDKPDTRFGLEHFLLNDFSRNCGVGILEKSVKSGNLVKGIKVPGGSSKFSRKNIDQLTSFVKKEDIGGAKGLIWLKVEENKLKGSVSKFISQEKQTELINFFKAEPGDIIFIITDKPSNTHKIMDNLRRKLAKDLELINPDKYSSLWVTYFPMFEKNEEGAWTSSHHPFTHPAAEDIDLLGTENQGEIKSLAYDLVINGNEIGGGSVRIHDSELQSKVFAALGISPEKQQELFGFLLEAFKYGVPPHAGFAGGLDRLAMVITQAQSLRDVIAFPKTVTGIEPMSGAPSFVEKRYTKELGIDIKPSLQ